MYKSDFNTLDKYFIKKKNTIFACHLLSMRRQITMKNTDEFLQKLHKLSKKCQFVNVPMEFYRQEFVREAFINGLTSIMMRQRLQENQDLTLSQACETARALEHAQYISKHYARADMQVSAAVTTTGENVPQS